MAIHAAWGLVALLGLVSPALGEDCRLALVLALDVSSSVDEAEHQLQREGLAQALVSPEVARAFFAGDPVAVYVFQWSGPSSQVPILQDWVVVGSADDLVRISGLIANSERVGSRHYTALGAALVHASSAFAAGPACRGRTVDVSSDGVNNEGPEPEAVYGTPFFDRVTVNALVVTRPPKEDTKREAWVDDEGQLVGWFQSAVLHGPGAFYVRADGYEDYERAMTAKLLRELEQPLVSGLPMADDGA